MDRSILAAACSFLSAAASPIDAWRDDDTDTFDSLAKQAKPLAKDDGVDTSPYAPKKKKKPQTAAGTEQGYDDLQPDGSGMSISDDDEAPIDR